MNTLLNIVIFLIYAVSSGSGLIILKTVMSQQPLSLAALPGIILQPKFFLGFFLYALGFATSMVILSKFRLNVAFPISTSLFFTISVLGSYFILKEPFTYAQATGIMLCLAGVLLISLK